MQLQIVDADRLYVRASSATLTPRSRFSMILRFISAVIFILLWQSFAAFSSGTFLQGLLDFAQKNHK